MNDWRPSATWVAVHRRADLFTTLRAFFAERGVLEVETPVLCSVGSTDLHLDQFSTHYRVPGAAAGRPFFLQTSPEFCMKRLLAAGSGPIYQLTKAFRNGEAGRRHNPEFTMLEWYRPDYDHHALMDEVDALLQRVLATPPAERISYGALCERHLEIAPHPAPQARLARLRPGPPVVAERFELYVDGMEIANGFHELTDAVEQRRRFAQARRQREVLGLPPAEMAERVLAALAHGLPAGSGVALGVDRLMMALIGARDIADVLTFPLDRC